MKGWITATLLVTFFSGASTGFLVGRESAPVPQVRTKIDQYVEHCRRSGVAEQADLDRIRGIYEAREKAIREQETEIRNMFRDQLGRIDEEYLPKIQVILDKYGEKR